MEFFKSTFGLVCLFLFLSTNTTIAQDLDGFALYNKGNNNTTYLIDKNGDIAHTWSNDRPCNYAVLLMENGNIMRGATAQSNQLNGATVAGLVQEIDPQGTVVWEFTYSSSTYVSHHDITLMPDGNVLLTAWEVKSNAELQALGYTGNSSKYPTHFVEVSQIEGTTQGEIVWEWHMIDHMIQDVDSNKPNYGVISEHPELMDINVPVGGGGPGGGGGDWFHVNGVNYSSERDQIVFSSRFLSEVIIIDHSTTTEEAASHSGGNSGKGGDFLYRWGNPSNYDVSGSQTIAGPVHDARWIPNDGRPRGGYIQFFNNEGVNGNSTVDAIELPFAADGVNYEWTAGQPYLPTTTTWRHTCLDNASGQSASNSMPNGNVFVNLSGSYMYEVDTEDNLIWQYNSDTQKGFRYTCDHPGVQVLINTEVVENSCPIIDDVDEIATENINILPNPSTGVLTIQGLTQEYDINAIQVFNILGEKVLESNSASTIDLTNQADGMYFISIRLNNNQLITKKITISK